MSSHPNDELRTSTMLTVDEFPLPHSTHNLFVFIYTEQSSRTGTRPFCAKKLLKHPLLNSMRGLWVSIFSEETTKTCKIACLIIKEKLPEKSIYCMYVDQGYEFKSLMSTHSPWLGSNNPYFLLSFQPGVVNTCFALFILALWSCSDKNWQMLKLR